MKKVLILFFPLPFLLLNCSSPEVPESSLSWQEHYELITNIKFPADFKIISNAPMPAGEKIRKTIIELNKKDCLKFSQYNGFTAVKDTISPLLFGSSMMDSVYRLIPDRNKFLHKYGKNYYGSDYFNYFKDKNTNWVYLLDTSTCRLYCLISYSNLYGYAK